MFSFPSPLLFLLKRLTKLCLTLPLNSSEFAATHYNTLQHTAPHCNTLQHTATPYMWRICCVMLRCCCNIAYAFSSCTTDVSSSRKEVLMGEEAARRCLHWRLRHSAPCRRAPLAPGSADRLAGGCCAERGPGILGIALNVRCS